MDFSATLTALKSGHCVQRDAWPTEVFAFVIPGSTFKVNRAPLLGILPEGTQVQYHPHLAQHQSDKTICEWMPSIQDIFAEDWHLSPSVPIDADVTLKLVVTNNPELI